VVVPSAEDGVAAASNVLLVDDEENDTLISKPMVPRTRFLPLSAGDFVHYKSGKETRLGHIQHLYIHKADPHQTVRMRLHKCWFLDEVPAGTNGSHHIRLGFDGQVRGGTLVARAPLVSPFHPTTSSVALGIMMSPYDNSIVWGFGGKRKRTSRVAVARSAYVLTRAIVCAFTPRC
jgi:hypothetical protein